MTSTAAALLSARFGPFGVVAQQHCRVMSTSCGADVDRHSPIKQCGLVGDAQIMEPRRCEAELAEALVRLLGHALGIAQMREAEWLDRRREHERVHWQLDDGEVDIGPVRNAQQRRVDLDRSLAAPRLRRFEPSPRIP